MMIGSFIARGLLLIFGYAYPAYQCYKTVELNRPDVNELRFWCQYWILVAGLTVLERIGDAFISWVPMYGEAKLAFFIYLWFPKTKGTSYIYDSFVRPYLARHEAEIDRHLLELQTRVGDLVIGNYLKVAVYGQTRVSDILKYIVSQSTQPLNQGTRAKTPAVSESESSAHTSNSSREQPERTAEQQELVANSKPEVSESSRVSGSSGEQASPVDLEKPPSHFIVQEEALQAKLRQRRVNSSR